jgi:hypothetical protein
MFNQYPCGSKRDTHADTSINTKRNQSPYVSPYAIPRSSRPRPYSWRCSLSHLLRRSCVIPLYVSISCSCGFLFAQRAKAASALVLPSNPSQSAIPAHPFTTVLDPCVRGHVRRALLRFGVRLPLCRGLQVQSMDKRAGLFKGPILVALPRSKPVIQSAPLFINPSIG